LGSTAPAVGFGARMVPARQRSGAHAQMMVGAMIRGRPEAVLGISDTQHAGAPIVLFDLDGTLVVSDVLKPLRDRRDWASVRLPSRTSAQSSTEDPSFVRTRL